MNVADLQQYLADLAQLLSVADAKKSATEIQRVAMSLDPFKAYSIADFANFLQNAEVFKRTGEDPTKKPSVKAKPEKIDFAALRVEVERLYATAGSAHVTLESIDALRAKLENLSKTDLVKVADSIQLVGMKNKKNKTEVLDAVINRIRSIKQSALRTSIIDRPG